MKHFSTIMLGVIAWSFTACNNQSKPAEGGAAKADNLNTTNYKAVMVMQNVKDYDAWSTAFADYDTARKAAGLTKHSIARDLNDDKKVYVFLNVEDFAKGKDFSTSEGLKEWREKAGVIDPKVTFVNVIRDDTSQIPQKERLMVVHHVKDFDAWLKVYDAEGIAKRSTFGTVDRLMARGADDPNTVILLFAVTDMEKAKARVTSPELKKTMEDAGVDGEPQISWFKWVMMSN